MHLKALHWAAILLRPLQASTPQVDPARSRNKSPPCGGLNCNVHETQSVLYILVTISVVCEFIIDQISNIVIRLYIDLWFMWLSGDESLNEPVYLSRVA